MAHCVEYGCYEDGKQKKKGNEGMSCGSTGIKRCAKFGAGGS